MPSCSHTFSKASWRTNLRFFKSFFLRSMAMSIRLLLALSWHEITHKRNSVGLLMWFKQAQMGENGQLKPILYTNQLMRIYFITSATEFHSWNSVSISTKMFHVWCNMEISDHDYATHVLVSCGGVHRISCSTPMPHTRWRQRGNDDDEMYSYMNVLVVHSLPYDMMRHLSFLYKTCHKNRLSC